MTGFNLRARDVDLNLKRSQDFIEQQLFTRQCTSTTRELAHIFTGGPAEGVRCSCSRLCPETWRLTLGVIVPASCATAVPPWGLCADNLFDVHLGRIYAGIPTVSRSAFDTVPMQRASKYGSIHCTSQFGRAQNTRNGRNGSEPAGIARERAQEISFGT